MSDAFGPFGSIPVDPLKPRHCPPPKKIKPCQTLLVVCLPSKIIFEGEALTCESLTDSHRFPIITVSCRMGLSVCYRNLIAKSHLSSSLLVCQNPPIQQLYLSICSHCDNEILNEKQIHFVLPSHLGQVVKDINDNQGNQFKWKINYTIGYLKGETARQIKQYWNITKISLLKG